MFKKKARVSAGCIILLVVFALLAGCSAGEGQAVLDLVIHIDNGDTLRTTVAHSEASGLTSAQTACSIASLPAATMARWTRQTRCG